MQKAHSNATGQNDAATLPVNNRDGGKDGAPPFLRLSDDGDAAVVAFLGSPHLHAVYWDGSRYRPYDDIARQRGLPHQVRVAINVAVCDIQPVARLPKMRIREVRVWEHSHQVHRQLGILVKTFRTGFWLYLVERHGQTGSAATRYSIIPAYSLDQHDRQALRSLSLFNLDDLYGADATGTYHAPPERISPSVVDAIHAALEKYPDPMTARLTFCRHFGIDKVAQLPREDLVEARFYLDQHQGRKESPFD